MQINNIIKWHITPQIIQSEVQNIRIIVIETDMVAQDLIIPIKMIKYICEIAQ